MVLNKEQLECSQQQFEESSILLPQGRPAAIYLQLYQVVKLFPGTRAMSHALPIPPSKAARRFLSSVRSMFYWSRSGVIGSRSRSLSRVSPDSRLSSIGTSISKFVRIFFLNTYRFQTHAKRLDDPAKRLPKG